MRRSFWLSMVALMLPMSVQADDYFDSVVQPISHCSTTGSCCVQQPDCWQPQCGYDMQSGSVCGNMCGCCESPKWIVSGGWLMLQRMYRDAPIIVESGTGVTILGSEDFNTNYESGFEVAARHALGCNNMIEARYFQVNDFDDSTSRTVLATDTIAGSSFAAAAGLGQTLGLNSDLRNAEINLILGNRCSQFRMLAGFRYISYDETLTINTPGSGLNVGEVENDLYGFQLGSEYDVVRNPCGLYLTAFGRGAVAYGETNSNSFGTGTFAYQASDNQNVPVYISEFGVRGGYQVTEHLSIDASYRGLFLYGVALAGEQISSTNYAAGTTFLNHGDVFFHGFTVGATLAW